MNIEPPSDMDRFLRDALINEIRDRYNRRDIRRVKVLWKCYDVIYGRPIVGHDLEWRKRLGYRI